MAIIEVDGLVKRYGDRTVVNEVSFAVEQGEIFGILGPNGAGKTTTVECDCGDGVLPRLPDTPQLTFGVPGSGVGVGACKVLSCAARRAADCGYKPQVGPVRLD